MAVSNIEESFLEDIFPEAEVDKNFREKLCDVLLHDPEFPTFPAAIAKLQEALNKPDANFEEIAALVKLDPGLTARLFSLVRSAAFAGVEVDNVENALFRLGLKETRAAVLATKFMTSFAHLKVRVDWNKFWLHSLLVARLTQNIADAFEPVSEKEYLAGLMHDVGKIIIAHFFPTQFKNIIREARQFGCAMYQAEQRVLGTTHAAISTALCRKWKLDEDIQKTIRFHHNPENAEETPFLSRCLFVADNVANMAADNIDENKFSQLGSPPEQIETVPSWKMLGNFTPRRTIRISIQDECGKARDSLQTIAN